MGGGIIWIELKRPGEMLNGFSQPPLPGQHHSQIIEGIRVVGLELEGPFVILSRLFQIPPGGQQTSQIIEGISIIGFELDGPLVMLDGFSQFALPGQYKTEITVGFGETGVALKRLLVILQRLRPSVPGQSARWLNYSRHRRHQVCVEAPVRNVDRFIHPSLGGQRDAQIIERFGIVRVELERPIEMLDGLIQLPSGRPTLCPNYCALWHHPG